MEMKKNVWSVGLAAFLFMVLLYSCSNTPDSKEEFLEEYGDFIEEVKGNKGNYTDEDWKKMRGQDFADMKKHHRE